MTTPARFHVVVEPAGWAFVADDSGPLLQSAELAGIVLPSSCRNGTCRTCLCRMEEGRARHLIAWPGLSADERREGYILPCCAVPESDLTLRVAGARRLPPVDDLVELKP